MVRKGRATTRVANFGDVNLLGLYQPFGVLKGTDPQCLTILPEVGLFLPQGCLMEPCSVPHGMPSVSLMDSTTDEFSSRACGTVRGQ